MTSLVAIGRFVTDSRMGLRSLVIRLQLVLVMAALVFPLTSLPELDKPKSFAGASIFLSDVLVLLAVLSAVAVRLLSGPVGRPRLATPLIGWPLLAFAILLLPGVVRGHERYGTSLLSQPLRLVIYAGIAAAMTELRPRETFRWLTAALYAGAFWQLVLAGYHIANGTTQTPISELSTGGNRVLSLTTGMFLAIAVVVALVNIDLEQRPRWRALHASFAGIALVGVVLAFGRTTFIALAVVLPFLAWQLKNLRASTLDYWRWWALPVAATVAGLFLFIPHTGTQLVDRVSANPLSDHSFRWRFAGIHATLAGMRSGDWDVGHGLTAKGPDGNQLVNPGFEDRTDGWLIQGARMFPIKPLLPGMGERSRLMHTWGLGPDEGFYSGPVVAAAGQTWEFSIWLQGLGGGEQANVTIWEYNDQENAIRRWIRPVILTTTPTRYVMRATLENPSTSHIRVLVRTPVSESVTIMADSARLRLLPRGQGNTSGSRSEYVGGDVVSPTITAKGTWVAGAQANVVSGAPRLQNGGFEAGADHWHVQGGVITPIPAGLSGSGETSLVLATVGTRIGEGVFSDPVAARPGQRWTFRASLTGRGNERMALSMWLYDQRAATRPVGRIDFPITLMSTTARFSVTGVIPPGGTRFIRARLHTRDRPRSLSALVDEAGLYLRAKQPSTTPPAGPTHAFQIDEPLLGLGFGRTTRYIWAGQYYKVEGDPDNSYVYLLAGGGILALGGFLFIFAAFLRDGFRRLRQSASVERGLVLWALAAWFIVALNCAMAPFLPRPKIVLSLWVIMLLPALVRRVRADERTS